MKMLIEETKIGQLCFNKSTGETYYYMGKRKVRGEIMNIFKKYTKQNSFLSGFWSFKNMSDFDESLKMLNKITIDFFQDELNKHPLFKSIK